MRKYVYVFLAWCTSAYLLSAFVTWDFGVWNNISEWEHGGRVIWFLFVPAYGVLGAVAFNKWPRIE